MPRTPTSRDEGVLGSTLVLLGGLVVAVLPASSWAADLPGRSSMPGRMAGLVVVVTGLGLLAHAWVRLWQETARGAADVGAVRFTTACWALPLVLAPPLFSRDGWSYAALGELTRLGLTPYFFGPGVLHGQIVEAVDPRWMWTPTPYGPLPLLLGSFGARVTQDPWALVVLHRAFALLGLALLAWTVPHLARWAGRDPAVATVLAVSSPLVVAHGVGGLHNDLLMVGLVAAALVVARDHSWWLGAVVAGLAAAVKLPGGVALLGVALVALPAAAGLWARVARGLQVGLVAGTTLLGVGVLAGTGQGWIGALSVPGSIDTPLAITALLDGVVPHARTIGMVVAALVAATVALRAPTGVPGAAVRSTAVVMTTVVLLSPAVHAWYFLWAVPLLAACRLGHRGTAVLVWVSTALGVAAPLDSSLSGLPVHVAVTTVLVVGTVVAVTWPVRPTVLLRRAARPSGAPSSTSSSPLRVPVPQRAPVPPAERAVAGRRPRG